MKQTKEPGCVYCLAVFNFKGDEEGGDETMKTITCMSRKVEWSSKYPREKHCCFVAMYFS
jgi:hypothetical protein